MVAAYNHEPNYKYHLGLLMTYNMYRPHSDFILKEALFLKKHFPTIISSFHDK